MTKIFDPIVSTSSTINKFKKMGIITYWDLLLNIPLRYDDLTKIYPIKDVLIGSKLLVSGTVVDCSIIQTKTRQLQVKISDGTGQLLLIFFHYYPSQQDKYAINKTVRAYGEIKLDYFGNKTIIHPKVEFVDNNDSKKLPNTFSPIYSTTKGLTQSTIIKLIDDAFSFQIYDPLPLDIQKRFNLEHLEKSLIILHKLNAHQFNQNDHLKAILRLKYDELIAQQITLYNRYQVKHANRSIALVSKKIYYDQLLSKLPFALTNAQNRVLIEIFQDLAKPFQMNRLLQGDVGSGKTIVATLSMLVAVENKYQACMMAPTELLAEQHFFKISQLIEGLPINIVWLSGSLSTSAKKIAYAKIARGEADIIIGTHAIFQKEVEFYNLALIIIDEQHRFGVGQRLQLQLKGLNPHQLMMSATPIPRTLAMSYYADLDVSYIDELPMGRIPIETKLINNHRRSEVLNYVYQQCRLNVQTYWVCPLIDFSEALDLENAINTFNELSNQMQPFKVGLVHGKLSATEKASIMKDFSAGLIQVLVATTVIEVGVDVPNATVMVIEHAERMGLSQLHQLRGRVGRGSKKSQCVLLYQNPLSELAKARLKVIYENTDGFEIAHQDLLIRGPGELLGAKQSGLPDLRFANLENDWTLIAKAKDIAKILVNDYPDAADLYLRLWINKNQQFLKA